MAKTCYRGELYYADLGKGVGSEQEGYRPVVIVQNNMGNKYSPTVIVAPVTTNHEAKAKLPTHCYIGAESGLDTSSVILLEPLRTIDKKRLGHFVGRLNRTHLRQLNHALAVSIQLTEASVNRISICLCSTCAKKFSSIGAFSLQQRSHSQKAKEVCAACKRSAGIDYEMIQRKRGK